MTVSRPSRANHSRVMHHDPFLNCWLTCFYESWLGLFFIAGALICGPLLRSSIRWSWRMMSAIPWRPLTFCRQCLRCQQILILRWPMCKWLCWKWARYRLAIGASESSGWETPDRKRRAQSGLVWYGLVVQTVAMAVQVMIHAIVQVWGVAVAHMSISPKNTSIRLSFLGSWRTHTPNPYLGRVPEGVTVSCQPCVLGPRGMFKNPNF